MQEVTGNAIPKTTNTELSRSSQAAVPGLIWLLSSMVQEVLRLMAEEISDDASTS